MRLNMYMVAEQLPWKKMDCHFSDGAKEDNLLQVKLFVKDMDILDRYLYLIEAKDFPAAFSNLRKLHFVILGECEDISFLRRNEVIIIREEESLLKVFDILQQSFEKYNIWEESLIAIVNGDANIQKMCDLSKPFFRNPLIVHDGNFEVLATTVNRKTMEYLEFYYHDDSDSYAASSNLLNVFKLGSVFQSTLEKTGVENYHADYPAYDVLYVNLSSDGFFPGRVVVPEYEYKNPESVYVPLARLGEMISVAIGRKNAMKKGYRRSLERLFLNLLQGAAVERGYADFCLLSKKWKVHDQYCCIAIDIRDTEIRSFSISYNCQRLEEIFKDCFAFFHDGFFICVCHFTESEEAVTSIGTEFGEFLRDGFFKAGISNMYHNIYEIATYFLQAKSALAIGNELDPQIWYYTFRQYALSYMLYYGIGKMSPEMFMDERILKLKHLGKKDGVDYFQTLKVYLENNMNLLHSSEALYIHRTTLFYRINRIKKVLHVDLNDKDERLPMLMSYYLMDLAAKIPK